jgi:hypothetical protein
LLCNLALNSKSFGLNLNYESLIQIPCFLFLKKSKRWFESKNLIGFNFLFLQHNHSSLHIFFFLGPISPEHQPAQLHIPAHYLLIFVNLWTQCASTTDRLPPGHVPPATSHRLVQETECHLRRISFPS